jgi:hypothetical protein
MNDRAVVVEQMKDSHEGQLTGYVLHRYCSLLIDRLRERAVNSSLDSCCTVWAKARCQCSCPLRTENRE